MRISDWSSDVCSSDLMNAAIATGMNLHVASGTDTCLDAGTKVHVKAGVNLVLEAGVMISLKVGGSSITIGPAGVTLDGSLVRINCGGSPLAAMKGEKPDKAKKAGEAIAGKEIGRRHSQATV